MAAAALMLLAAPAAVLTPAATPVVTLAQAVRSAELHQPQLRLAHANTDAARARTEETRAALLPQLAGTGSYQRTTSNFAPRPGLLPSQVNAQTQTGPTFQTFDYWSFGLELDQYLFDLRAPFAFGASRATAEAQAAGERSVHDQVVLAARVAFFTARAQKALAEVARHNVADQKRHLDQSRAFVEEGVRPEIDVAQADTNYANAEVQALNADNAYQVAKAQLNQAMGVEGGTDYEVADEVLPPVAGEDAPLPELELEAMKTRPDLASLERQLHAQALTVRAVRGAYGPTFSATMALTDLGPSLGSLVWNWNVTFNVSWTLFDGLYTHAQVKEAKATARGLEAQRDALRQQVILDVTQAQLQVRAARATLAAAHKAKESARLQLGLAEGRYTEGIGNQIELGDAQLAFVTAEAQEVQADYTLAIARAQLARALGRR